MKVNQRNKLALYRCACVPETLEKLENEQGDLVLLFC